MGTLSILRGGGSETHAARLLLWPTPPRNCDEHAEDPKQTALGTRPGSRGSMCPLRRLCGLVPVSSASHVYYKWRKPASWGWRAGSGLQAARAVTAHGIGPTAVGIPALPAEVTSRCGS